MNRRHSSRPNGLASELPPISYVWETPNRRPRRAEWDIPDPTAPGRLTLAMRTKLERIVRQGATLAGRSGFKDLQQRWEDDAGLDDKRRRDASLLGATFELRSK